MWRKSLGKRKLPTTARSLTASAGLPTATTSNVRWPLGSWLSSIADMQIMCSVSNETGQTGTCLVPCVATRNLSKFVTVALSIVSGQCEGFWSVIEVRKYMRMDALMTESCIRLKNVTTFRCGVVLMFKWKRLTRKLHCRIFLIQGLVRTKFGWCSWRPSIKMRLKMAKRWTVLASRTSW